jgi:Right handed beta helix region
MKNIYFLKSILCLLFLFSGSLYAQNYYVCNQGSNTNSGISPNQPWATFDFAMSKFGNLKAGDAISFCRNGTFTSSYPRLFNQKCTRTQPCTLNDYIAPNTIPQTAGSYKLPIIQSIGINGVLNFQDGGNADHDEGYVVKNLSLKGNRSGSGIFLYNDVDYLTIDGVILDGFSIGMYVAGANTPNAGANWSSDNIVLKNSTISNNKTQGWFGGCNNCLIDNNKFVNNGFAKMIYNHNIYIGGNNNFGIVISNNILYHAAFVTGKCSGVSLVVHGVVRDLTIQGNVVYEDLGAARPTCWGISVDPGYASEESFTNVLISNNIVSNVSDVGIGCASCTKLRIINNQITHSQDFSFTAIKVPVRAEDTVKSDNITITGNSINLLDINNRSKLGIIAPLTGTVTIGSNTTIFSK